MEISILISILTWIPWINVNSPPRSPTLQDFLSIYNSEVPDTAGRITRRRRTQVIAKHFAFYANSEVSRIHHFILFIRYLYNTFLTYIHTIQYFDVKYMDILKTSFRYTVRGTFTTLSNVFAKQVNVFQPLIIFAKCFILDVWQGSEIASVMYIFVKHEMGTLSHRQCRNMYNTKCLNNVNESNYSSLYLR